MTAPLAIHVHKPLAKLRQGRDWLFMSSRVSAPLQWPWLPYALCCVIVVLYICWQLVTQSRFILGGDMWAEMATNYYLNAHASSLLDRLFSTDAGYIPFPQRVVALLVALVGTSAGATPYVYTAIALLGSAVLVGAICLPTFRVVIPSDWLRFALAILILGTVDFQSRTFINATYFVVPLAIFMMARAIATEDQVPRWFWVLPPLLMSKPAVLVIVPAIVVAVILGGRRIRLIGAVSLAVAAIQVVRLYISSRASGSLLEASQVSGVNRILNGIRYSLGGLSRYIAGPNVPLPHLALLLCGTFAALVILAVILLRGRAGALILIASSTLVLGMLLNTETFSSTFGGDLSPLGGILIDRRFSVPIWSVLIILVGSLSQVLNSARRPLEFLQRGIARPLATVVAVVVLIGWAAGTGWLTTIIHNNEPLGEPTIGVSSWEVQQDQVAKGLDVCTTVDPIGWVYGPHCAAGDSTAPLYLGPYERINSERVTVDTTSSSIRGAALLIKANGPALIELESDGRVVMRGRTVGNGSAQMVQLTVVQLGAVKSGDHLRLVISTPVEVWQAGPGTPAVLWLVRK